MARRTTHVRVSREILEQARLNFPEYTANDLFKIGYTTINGLNKANEIIYGSKRVKKARGLL